MLKEGQVVGTNDIHEWGKYMESPEGKQSKKVASAKINGMLISTVFLGLDHGFGGPPLYFETMIFTSEKDFSEQYQKRYTTYQQAADGHHELVMRLLRGVKVQDLQDSE